MDQFNVSKRRLLTFDQFKKQAKLSSDADHDENGEAEITKNAMPGEANPKKGTEVLDKVKTESGKHDLEKTNMSGADNGKGGRDVLDDPERIKIKND